jgi:outer membrane protein assembly factor BamB
VVLDGQILAWSSDRVVSVDQVTGREVWVVDGLAATSVVPAVNGFSVAEAGGLRLFRR